MTKAELTEKYNAIRDKILSLKKDKRALVQQMDAADAVEEAQAILSSVSPETKKRLAQELSASGFDNGSSVGTPGA